MSTITTTMSPIPLLKHRNSVVTLADQDEFVTKYEATNDHLSNNTVVEVNAICNEIDVVASEINQESVNITTQTGLMSGYVASSKQYRDESQAYANASQTSYENTVQVIADADITGTSGYTMDAVDNKIDDIELEEFINFN